MNYIKILLVGAFSSLLMVSCNEDSGLTESVEVAPTITSFEPSTGALGDEITVYGTDLSAVVSATIGGGAATVKYRVDATMLVLEVTGESRDGAITVSSYVGSGTSSESFDVDHTLVPTVSEMLIPYQEDQPTDETAVYDEFAASSTHVVLEGSDLNAVTAVMLGSYEATILIQSESELVFLVPVLDYSQTLELNLSYYNGSSDTATNVCDFYVLVLIPSAYEDYVPDSLTKYSPFTLYGYNMDLFNSFYVESSDGEIVSLSIKSQTSTAISVDINSSFYDESFTGDLYAIYNVDKSVTLATDFVLYANPYEHRYGSQSGLFIDIRTNSGGTDNSFMDLSDLFVYDACAVESGNLLSLIDVVTYHKGLTYMQMRSPSSMSSTLKNFSCTDTGNSASTFEGLTDFYLKYTYFWVLDVDGTTYPAHKTFLDAFNDGNNPEDATGVAELSAEYFASIDLTLEPTDLTTGTYYGPSIYEAGTYTEYQGLSTADIANYPYMIVYSVDDDKYGLIKVTSSLNDGASYMLSLTFDLFY